MKLMLTCILAAICCMFVFGQTPPPDVLAAKHEHKLSSEDKAAEHERMLQESWTLNGYNVKQLNSETYHTPNMVAGLMFMTTALTIFFCGCCCLSSVTTPKEFSEKPLTIAKEW